MHPRIKEVQEVVYITSNGARFDSRDMAEQYQTALDLAKELADDPKLYWRENNPMDVATWILERYTLSPKL
jgi:hypothetical protein